MFSFLNAIVSGSPLGRIYATTNKPYYVAGELITGNICCESKGPLAAQGIDLKVTGYEKTEWHDLTHRTEVVQPAQPGHDGQPGRPAVTRSIPVMHRHRGKKVFFSQNIRVYNIGGGLLAPGTYNFPFSYQLPEGLPGSFHERHPMPQIPQGCEWKEDDAYGGSFGDSDDEFGGQDNGRSGLLAKVHYKLKVTLDVNNFIMPDMHARIPLIIHPKLEASLQPAQQTLSQDIKVCCCINKGKCTVTARFDKLAYVAGEVANVRCDINNESTATLKTRVCLRRYLILRSNTGQKALTEDLITAAYDPVPGQTNSVDRPMPLQLTGPKIAPSTTGDFVKCNYEYLVVCDVSMGPDLNLKMPLTVYMPQPPPIGGPSSPAPPVVVLSPQQPQMMMNSPQPMPGQQQQMQYPSQPMQPGMQQQQQQYQSQPMQPQQGQQQYQQQPQQGQYPPQQQQFQPQPGMQQQQQQYQSQSPQQLQQGQPQQQYQQQPQQGQVVTTFQ